jgi:hypothetical protein
MEQQDSPHYASHLCLFWRHLVRAKLLIYLAHFVRFALNNSQIAYIVLD